MRKGKRSKPKKPPETETVISRARLLELGATVLTAGLDMEQLQALAAYEQGQATPEQAAFAQATLAARRSAIYGALDLAVGPGVWHDLLSDEKGEGTLRAWP